MQSLQASESNLDHIFFALADKTRRAILLEISQKTCTVGELAAPHQMSLPAISKHLKVLEKSGALRKTKEGRVIHCDLDPAPLVQAAETLEHYRQFWEDRFAGLEAFLAELQAPSKHKEDL